ncbi:hypothetical protein [Chelativorans sp. AA-79]|uniref:hypothetical protein n=1 Tax=Chelativorans sp. AA-79 TaxID=3028735 RepID=UPI0023F934CF|nr:hypothetical protein [Chelativorans sp. AA-79]WEX10270.1 hypothetical protein PVE73_04740 [Chelativorans sp. AA-79]
MTGFTMPAEEVFAPQDAGGVERSVVNRDAQVWGTEVERAIFAFKASGGLIFKTKAEADANLDYDFPTEAWVIADPVGPNNGIYQKQGASGGGSWLRVGDLPYSFIRAANAGAGTANAIIATTSMPIPAADGGALITVPILLDNTADAPTIQFNGDAPLIVTDALGNSVGIGALMAGMLMAGYKVGSTFRMITGPRGWSPLVRSASDGDRRVVEVYDWVGGQGAKPTATGYISPTGLTSNIASATDFRGPPGPSGPGTGDMLKSVYDPTGVEADAFDRANHHGPIVWPVADRTELKALNTAIFSTAFLKEDGREGTFILKSGSPPVTDTQEGVYVVSDTAGFYWERLWALPSVRFFGATLDGSTEDSAAVQGALNVLGTAYIPYTSTGFVAGDITLDRNQKIMAERKTTWKTPAAANYAVRVLPYAGDIPDVQGFYAVIANFRFDLEASPTSTTAIRFGTSTGVVFGFRGTNLDFASCGEAIGDEAHASFYIVDVEFHDCQFLLTRGRQIYSRRSRGFITFRGCHIDHTQNTPPVTWEGARFEDSLGLEIEKFTVTGPVTTTHQASATGLVINGGTSVWLNRVLVDSTSGPGVLINNVADIQSVMLDVYGNLGTPVYLNNVSKGSFSVVRVRGGIDLTGAAAGANGITLEGCTDVVMTGAEIDACTGNGHVMISCTDCKVIGGHAKGNGGYGYVEATAATRNLRSGVASIGNTTGSLVQIGAQSATVNWWAAAGVFTDATAGAATI